ncbi:MAG: TolC family protein [Lautropia sp.]
MSNDAAAPVAVPVVVRRASARRRRCRAWGTAIAVSLLAFAAGAHARVGCIEAGARPAPDAGVPVPQGATGTDARARALLRDVIGQALAHSQAVGAARLLAQAAALDVEEARAARLPRAALTAGVAHAASSFESREQYRGGIARGGINLSVPVYDAGRTAETVNWRGKLAEAARLAQLDAQEQVALQTLSLVLDLDRYEQRAQVSQQQVARMQCLVSVLERAVTADPGRRSELDQARKTLQEAELTRSRSAASRRQVEIRLARFTGGATPAVQGLGTVLGTTPPLDELVAAAGGSTALRQLGAQADAADAQARAIAASGKARVDLALDGTRTAGATETTSWQVGLNLVVPLFEPGLARAAEAAAQRGKAARLQLADATEARVSRVADVHDQAGALARDIDALEEILQSSARVREATLLQWRKLGRRSLFDVMSAERDHFGLRIAQVDAQHDRQQANALLRSLGAGIDDWLRPSAPPGAAAR